MIADIDAWNACDLSEGQTLSETIQNYLSISSVILRRVSRYKNTRFGSDAHVQQCAEVALTCTLTENPFMNQFRTQLLARDGVQDDSISIQEKQQIATAFVDKLSELSLEEN